MLAWATRARQHRARPNSVSRGSISRTVPKEPRRRLGQKQPMPHKRYSQRPEPASPAGCRGPSGAQPSTAVAMAAAAVMRTTG